MMGALNGGGRGYYALDVTDPTAPKILWEFTSRNDADLGYSFGNPLAAKKADGTSRILALKSEVMAGDTLATAEDSYARVKFTEGGEVTLRPNSQLEIREYSYEADRPERDNIVLGLAKGGLRAITGLIGKRNQSKVQINTNAGTIGIRGTNLGALQCDDDCEKIRNAAGTVPANGLHVDVSEGAIAFTNNRGTQEYAAGQFGYVRDLDTPPAMVPSAEAPQSPPPPVSAVSSKRCSPIRSIEHRTPGGGCPPNK